MGKSSRLFKVGMMSIVLGVCAPLVALSLLGRQRLEPRLVAFAQLVHSMGARLSDFRDSWRHEVSVYEVLTGNMPGRPRRP